MKMLLFHVEDEVFQTEADSRTITVGFNLQVIPSSLQQERKRIYHTEMICGQPEEGSHGVPDGT